MDKLIFWTVVD